MRVNPLMEKERGCHGELAFHIAGIEVIHLRQTRIRGQWPRSKSNSARRQDRFGDYESQALAGRQLAEYRRHYYGIITRMDPF
jgi:hypothetical protein